MAIVKPNPVILGISGKMGSFIFRNLRGKTVVARAPKRSKQQTDRQRGTRNRFRLATEFAKAAMQDAERKAYYQKMAKKLKLPNAYTAAITDYMRKPVVTKAEALINNDRITLRVDVHKRNFVAVKKMTVMAFDKDGSVVAEKTVYTNYLPVHLPLTVSPEHLLKLAVIVLDEAGNVAKHEINI